jgi:hypothetical protein
MASVLNAERGATLLSQARNSSIESSYRPQAASSAISPLCTAATTAALRRIVHLLIGGGNQSSVPIAKSILVGLFACHAGRSAALSERWVGRTRAVLHYVIPLMWKNAATET